MGLMPSDVQVIGTSALREASNKDTFIDRISLQTGFHVRIIEDIEENHLMYLAVKKALEDERSYLSRSNAMILEVGGGTTELMILRKGPNGSSHSLSIGTLRIDEQIRESAQQPRQFIEMYLESNIRTACDILAEDLQLDSLRIFVLYWCGRALCRKLPFRKSPGQLRGTGPQTVHRICRLCCQHVHRGMHGTISPFME